MRQVILDTETTGLEPAEGHRIIEIGCVEMVQRKLTQRTYHQYINPEREVDAQAAAVHGLTTDRLVREPKFGDIVDAFIEFVRGSELIIHNAPFDVGFINHELALANCSFKLEDICQITDTLVIARELRPGKKNSLDALCKEYGVDNSHRELHGALLDSEILADVYLLMTGGQTSLGLQSEGGSSDASTSHDVHDFSQLIFCETTVSDDEIEAHEAFIKKMATKCQRVLFLSQ